MSNKPVKVTLFHANWCGHCQNFMPIWNEMVENKNANKNIEFLSIESAELDSLTDKEKQINGEEIQGFPTIKITINNRDYNYQGTRETNDIYSFIIKKIKQGQDISENSEITNDDDTIKNIQSSPYEINNRYYTQFDDSSEVTRKKSMKGGNYTIKNNELQINNKYIDSKKKLQNIIDMLKL